MARRTLDEVRDEAQAQGFTTADAKDAAGDLKERMQAVYERGKEALEKEVDQTLEPAPEDAAKSNSDIEAQPSTGDDARDSLTPRPT